MAANPVTVVCTKNTWVKVATAVTSGTIYKRSILPERYLQTIRLTGGAVPTDNDDAASIFECRDQAGISSDAAIDVYIKARGAAGEVRVDL
jgi:hypothetical protein